MAVERTFCALKSMSNTTKSDNKSKRLVAHQAMALSFSFMIFKACSESAPVRVKCAA
eukprot:CAMPEP_0116023962 /NCGR_PEP_ID=MMETSP0321-20121206/11988_1 /TAXON_ID=163516 /ORGANISM="Leptocylindrus danicus var. danicus, Strain B650" /LENGTH=56 /DNA_ID=CAMNT_0003495511 /DNA_START=291 /DNA_END=461 /DNA_ORIENTATION=-